MYNGISPRYKLFKATSFDPTQAPGATVIDGYGWTWVLTPVGVWWTPDIEPANCRYPDRFDKCAWAAVAEGKGIDLHVPKGGCPNCQIGNGSIGIIHKDGYLWYHGYIQHGWLEGD